MTSKKERIYEIKKKSPGKAAVFSFFVAGIGHLYLGQLAKAAIYFVLMVILWSIWLGWIMWFIMPFIAYKDAKEQNELLRLEMKL